MVNYNKIALTAHIFFIKAVNTLDMGKISDKIVFNLTAILVSFAWSHYILKSYKWSVLATILIFILIRTFYAFYLSRKKSLKNISSNEMCISFALMGGEKAAKHIYNSLPEGQKLGIDGQYYYIKKEGQKVMVMVNYKFANTVPEDVAKAYRKAKNEGDIKEIILLSKQTDRAIMTFAARLDINFKFLDRRMVRKHLINKNAMPNQISSLDKKPKRVGINYKELISVALEKRRIKYYLFVGITIFIMSFFTPFKLYYLILTSLPLTLAGLSAFYSLKD